MRRGGPPGFAVGNADQTQRAVAQREGQGGAGAVEAGGNDEGAESAMRPARFEQELCAVAH